MTPKKTILIVDDHPLVREGLKSILKPAAGYEVVGQAGNARNAVRMVKNLKPDLVLLDLALPDKSGLDVSYEIRNISPTTRIMIVSMHSKVDNIVKAFQAGATGYVDKESASERLLQGIESVLNGEYFMDSSISHKVVQKLQQAEEKELKITDSNYESLTPREQEIMVMLAEGYSAKEIAARLFISPKTAENHRTNIMNKLGLHSTLELVRYAAKVGLVDVDLWKG
jgi:DNA-binding NarL/FixJ family response regulator